jgi:hypothetical protein
MKPRVLAVVILVTAILGGCSNSKSSDNPTVGASATNGGGPRSQRPATTAAAGGSVTTATAAAGGGLSGTWSGDYQQTSPAPAAGTFTLNWQQSGSNVTGTINIPGACNACPISATVNGSSVTFGVVALGGIIYTGTVSGNSMSGTYTTADTSARGTWKASKG